MDHAQSTTKNTNKTLIREGAGKGLRGHDAEDNNTTVMVLTLVSRASCPYQQALALEDDIELGQLQNAYQLAGQFLRGEGRIPRQLTSPAGT